MKHFKTLTQSVCFVTEFLCARSSRSSMTWPSDTDFFWVIWRQTVQCLNRSALWVISTETPPGLFMKTEKDQDTKESQTRSSQNEGTAKAEELDQLQCLWGCKFFGMHIRKNSCGWKNKENKYCLEQYLFMLEITRCHAFLPGWWRCGSDWVTVKRPQRINKIWCFNCSIEKKRKIFLKKKEIVEHKGDSDVWCQCQDRTVGVRAAPTQI